MINTPKLALQIWHQETVDYAASQQECEAGKKIKEVHTGQLSPILKLCCGLDQSFLFPLSLLNQAVDRQIFDEGVLDLHGSQEHLSLCCIPTVVLSTSDSLSPVLGIDFDCQSCMAKFFQNLLLHVTSPRHG